MQTETIEKFKHILVNSFEKNAQVFQKNLSDVHYCFLLKDSHHYKCLFGKLEIHLLDHAGLSFITKPVVAMKVNQFITEALLKFSRQHQIQLGFVNVLMSIDENKNLYLMLRNGGTNVKEIKIEELIT